MSEKKNTPTFGKDEKRRFRCRNEKCKAYIASKYGGAVFSYKGEKKTRKLRCAKCGYEGFYSPPIIEIKEGEKNIIYWNADENGMNGISTLEDEPT